MTMLWSHSTKHPRSPVLRLPVTRKQERENAAAKQKPGPGNSLQDSNSRFASAPGGSSLYPLQIQQDRPISEAVEHTKIVATICGWRNRALGAHFRPS